MDLFDVAIDYSKDLFRNIRSIRKSQNLFDDLSDDPLDWDAANELDIYIRPSLVNHSMIQRAFNYSKNDFINYPFEHTTASRFSDGSFACWYGCETLKTSIYETRYHFIQDILDSPDAFADEEIIYSERKVGEISCHGLAFDLSKKVQAYPWLIDKLNYSKCQEIGKRVAREGHPLLRVASARDEEGINMVAFNDRVLSNVRDFCYLTYSFDMSNKEFKVHRRNEEIMFI
ncbi:MULTISPECIES: RES family NAD+ phosphorylase [unclassified Legionella]|uniref:RES family NAD+ phosphorylase n=1 Tax=unclassified Legionella TaxID=2622702 RepID=UPI001A943EE8|nr:MULTISPECIES: RES family NAD+ phosphorylase [unclassified Legionella]MDI9819277.1 RES family NAD+ phosphorylase [Legionella sp. PL877]